SGRRACVRVFTVINSLAVFEPGSIEEEPCMRSLPVFLLLTASLLAQSDRGTVTGTVSDPANALVPGATVVARHTETGAQYETVTTPTGNYTLPALQIGVYEVTVSAAGFNKSVQQGVRVQVAQTLRVDVTLQVGATTESISVSASAPLLKTESAE